MKVTLEAFIRARVIACLFAAAALSSSTECAAQRILLVHGGHGSEFEHRQFVSVAAWLGVGIQEQDSDRDDVRRHLMSEINDPRTLAIVFSAEALGHLDGVLPWASLQAAKNRRVPIMIYGVTANTSPRQLTAWSSGAIRQCAPVKMWPDASTIEVEPQGSITRQLGGQKLPAVSLSVCGLDTVGGPAAQTLLSAMQTDGNRAAIFVRTVSSSHEAFFLAQMRDARPSKPQDITDLPAVFSSIAPFVFFLSHAAGEYAWHTSGHYANLTIDDAWLVQPYGHLDYKSLLAEMEQHNFHTTAAFVPWNFDRSRPDVITLFRSHPDRFSVCVHGNNHAHREFGDYRRNSLANQIADIKQAVARMERFTVLTHIPYDRFMVFPHGVAPEPTFAALRTYGFLGTANSSNVPLGEPFPYDPGFVLRPFTANYGNLLSLYRYPAAGDVPEIEVAIHAFLGNPILFYDHSSLFQSGITAFNAHADFVNRVQPDTQWTNLGEIARHSYLLRKRGDGATDVLMLSSEATLENPTTTERVFYIHRTNASGIGGSLAADGIIANGDNWSEAKLIITAHSSRVVRVTYPNDLNLSQQQVSTRSLYVYGLRMISDFRDIYLSKSSVGKSLVRGYYRYGWDSAELFLERRWWLILAIGVAAYGGFRYCRNRMPGHTRQSARP